MKAIEINREWNIKLQYNDGVSLDKGPLKALIRMVSKLNTKIEVCEFTTFNGGFFALRVWGAYKCMGLYFLVFLFELFVAQCIQVKKWRSALWLNAMHSGKK